MGLFNSTVLDVIIGLVFVYLLLSILCTAANEFVAALTRRRGKMLRKGIQQLLENQPKGSTEFLDAFYKHPLIASMMHDKNHPTYLSPRTFTAVVTDLLTAAKPGIIDFDDLQNGAIALPNGDVKTSVLALVQRANRTSEEARLEEAQRAIEGWFNDAMDRVTGWYKRRTQVWTLIVAIALTLVANADTVQIAKKLWQDPVLRTAVVEEAKVRAQKPRPTVSVEYKDEDDPTNPTVTRHEGNQLSGKERELLGQMLGWHGPFRENLGWSSLLGWLLTVLALSMGAPFWFDMLNKIMNVRFAGKSPDEASKTPEKKDAKVRA
jgi:hypothetical protein